MPTKKITNAERLFIWRRREERTQAQQAERFGVTEDVYRSWELIDGAAPRGKACAVGELTPVERCVLERRRQGITQRDLAARMGISRRWLVCMENGTAPSAQLLKFWGK